MNEIHSIVLNGENSSTYQCLLSLAGVKDNTDLSKKYSDTPNRYLLAFFVPSVFPVTHTGNTPAQTHLPQFTRVNRHTHAHSVPSYGGVTLQNKRKPICKAVTVFTESEPRHPMPFHSVVITQNNTGGH